MRHKMIKCGCCNGTGLMYQENCFCEDCKYYKGSKWCRMGVKTSLTINKKRCAYKNPLT